MMYNRKYNKSTDPKRVYQQVGTFIRSKREDLGYGQADLANLLGISQVHLSAIELGNRSVGVPLLLHMADVLKFSLSELDVYKAKRTTKALTYIEHGKFALLDKPKPEILDPRDAVVRVTLGSICTSDLHIKHGSVPRAVPGITVGHEMVGVVESVGSAVTTVKPGDRVTVNVETFCGEGCGRALIEGCIYIY